MCTHIYIYIYIHIHIYQHLRSHRGLSVAFSYGLSAAFSNGIAIFSGIFQRIVTCPVGFYWNRQMGVQWHFPMELLLLLLLLITITINYYYYNTIVLLLLRLLLLLLLLLQLLCDFWCVIFCPGCATLRGAATRHGFFAPYIYIHT